MKDALGHGSNGGDAGGAAHQTGVNNLTTKAATGAYVSQLQTHFKDNTAFDSILDKIKNDKTLSKADLHEIASSVSGFKLGSGTMGKAYNKGSLIQSIRTTQGVRQRQDARASILWK